MSVSSTQIKLFLDKVEENAVRRISYKSYLTELISAICNTGKKELLGEIIFLGKFLHNAMNIMNRIGANGEGYEKLQSEFVKNTDKLIGQLKVVSIGLKNEFDEFALAESLESFKNFSSFVEDLNLLKNYELDTHKKICEELTQ
jgi:hypothetical protein